MPRSFALFIFAIVFAASAMSSQVRGCTTLTLDEVTRQGYSSVVVFKEKKTRRIISGIVTLSNDGPQRDVFVEVYIDDRPRKTGRRVAGCRTNASGSFEFANLPKGRYTLQLSKDGGFQITEIYVKVDPSAKQAKPIAAELLLGA